MDAGGGRASPKLGGQRRSRTVSCKDLPREQDISPAALDLPASWRCPSHTLNTPRRLPVANIGKSPPPQTHSMVWSKPGPPDSRGEMPALSSLDSRLQ